MHTLSGLMKFHATIIRDNDWRLKLFSGTVFSAQGWTQIWLRLVCGKVSENNVQLIKNVMRKTFPTQISLRKVNVHLIVLIFFLKELEKAWGIHGRFSLDIWIVFHP